MTHNRAIHLWELMCQSSGFQAIVYYLQLETDLNWDDERPEIRKVANFLRRIADGLEKDK